MKLFWLRLAALEISCYSNTTASVHYGLRGALRIRIGLQERQYRVVQLSTKLLTRIKGSNLRNSETTRWTKSD